MADSSSTSSTTGSLRSRVSALTFGAAVIAAGIGGTVWAAAGANEDTQRTTSQQTCAEGDVTVELVADPAAEAALTEAVQHYADSNPVVQDYCVSATVDYIDSDTALAQINAGELSPAGWVPLSWEYLDEVSTDTVTPAGTDPQSTGQAYPTLLVSDTAGEDLGAASWAEIGERVEAGELRLGSDARSTALAGQALAAMGSPTAVTAVDLDNAEQLSGVDAVVVPHGTTVPAGFTAVQPSGSTPLLTLPGQAYRGPAIDELAQRAATDFFSTAAAAAPTDGPADLTIADPQPLATARAAAAAITGAAEEGAQVPVSSGGRTVVLVDVSGSMALVENGATRLASTVAALQPAIEQSPDEVFLWDYSSPRRGGSSAYRELIAFDAQSPTADSAALVTDLSAEGATWTMTSVAAAYAQLAADYQPGDRIVVITDGPDDQFAYSPDGLVAATAGTGVEITVDVIGIGDRIDQAQLNPLVEATGGRYVTVGAATDPEFAELLQEFLNVR